MASNDEAIIQPVGLLMLLGREEMVSTGMMLPSCGQMLDLLW